MSDYEAIKAACLSEGKLWEDPDFPALQSSVFYHQTPPFQFVWKRPKEIYDNATFIMHNNETFDIVPGKMGDKWLVSCLGILHLCDGLFYRVVPADQSIDTAYAGIFRFRIWWCGQWVEVLVDDRLPTHNDALAFMQPTTSNQLWASLLEKAYAKLHGSYEALKYGSVMDGLGDLTGGVTDVVDILNMDVSTLERLLTFSSIVTVHCMPTVKESVKCLDIEMNYAICEVKKIVAGNLKINLVRLLRPPATVNRGPTHLVYNNQLWEKIPFRERQRLTTNTRGFWMLFSDLKRYFTRFESVHLDADTSMAEPSLANCIKWQMKIYQGSWKKGVNAGGCRNNADFFHNNPQIQIHLPEADTVIMALNQHCVMEPKVIGFSVYKMNSPLTETAPAQFFKKNKSAINSQYGNSRLISVTCVLEPAYYIILPTTFVPREEGSFTLRFFSNKSINMTVLDDHPQMTRQALIKVTSEFEQSSFTIYESLFLQLSDENKTINVFDLQELLDTCLPNDYIKSCSSIDTCRQIVLTLDTSDTGRISLSDFKDLVCSLKHWQLIFKKHAVEKMGVLRAERLKCALKEVGFAVPERVMTQIILRYMRKDGMLRFGDYVSAVMHLQRAFSYFYNKVDTSNVLHMNLSEFPFAVWTEPNSKLLYVIIRLK